MKYVSPISKDLDPLALKQNKITSNSKTKKISPEPKIKISIIVPVYNEFGNIKKFHKELIKSLISTRKTFEIIYIDDHSNDGTYKYLKSLEKKEYKVNVYQKKGLKGKSYSLIEGFSIAKGEIFVMIDGDLQYPPSAIKQMVQELQNADIIVARRKNYKAPVFRKFLSKAFTKVFGTLLFGLNTDVQSGLKAFKREVFHSLQLSPTSPWTFDLEFLHRSVQAGYKLKNIDITFETRTAGTSKINVFKQSIEIGQNALALRLKKQEYIAVPPSEPGSMRNAGLKYNKKQYTTHTTLPNSLLALQTFTTKQKSIILILLLIAGFSLLIKPLLSLRIIFSVLSILYFIDTVFNLVIITRSLNKKEEISFSENELKKLDQKDLPIYTVFCPLYRESHILPQFIEAINKLDWPKNKLDVLLLLEEDDKDTIDFVSRMLLPEYVRIIIVPQSLPKTKPKACNYGLSFAKGEYSVIYDAEDIPDPLQLKKAYLAFQKVTEKVICLQAKLNYYNARQNILTRFFSAEYLLWFDLTLPGLQSYNTTIPLGGTSNHFRTKDLINLKGWDPFNVTEDADLGIRLFNKGYQTAIIDSVTYEEATSKVKNWLKQRSRWLKGYMQTYLVHTRDFGIKSIRYGIFHNLIFHLTIGGKLLFIFLNPMMWIITLTYFLAYQTASPLIESVFIAPVSYLAICSWIFGNFMFFYFYMIACGKQQQWDITKYTIFIPFYWILMSVAGAIAFYQLLFKPHYWEKTVHGFHLKKEPSPETETAEIMPQPAFIPEPVRQGSFVPVYAMSGNANTKTEIPQIMSKGGAAHKINTSKKQMIINKISSFLLSKKNKLLLKTMPIVLILFFDIFLAFIYLAPEDFSKYLSIAVIGKIIFSGSLITAFVYLKSVNHNMDWNKKFNKAVFLTFIFSWFGFVLFGLFSPYHLSSLLPFSQHAAYPYTTLYLFASMCFAVSIVFVLLNVQRKKYSFYFILLNLLIMQYILMLLQHDSLINFVKVSTFSGALLLITMVILQIDTQLAKTIENNSKSVFNLFNNIDKHFTKNGNKLKILIFNWRDTKHIFAGGAEVYVHELAKRWVRDGNLVTIFSGNDNKSPEYENFDGIHIFRRGGTYTVYLFAAVYYLLKFRGKYDVIIDCENGIPFFTPLFAKEQVILLIFHVHQEVFKKYLVFPLNRFAAFLEKKVMPFLYKQKQIVTISDSSRNEILQLGFTNAKNINIIRCGVSGDIKPTAKKTTYPSFLYLGRLKQYKNIDTAINSFAEIVKKYKKARLSIVGGGEYYYKLQKLVDNLGLGNSVTFYGRVSEGKKVKMLSQHWALIQPSEVEGWGISVIEANAAGTPVVASQVNGLKDSVIEGTTGFLAEKQNIRSFASAMHLLIDNKLLRTQLAENALTWSKNFNWDISAKNFYTLINKSLQEVVEEPYVMDFYNRAALQE